MCVTHSPWKGVWSFPPSYDYLVLFQNSESYPLVTQSGTLTSTVHGSGRGLNVTIDERDDRGPTRVTSLTPSLPLSPLPLIVLGTAHGLPQNNAGIVLPVPARGGPEMRDAVTIRNVLNNDSGKTVI